MFRLTATGPVSRGARRARSGSSPKRTSTPNRAENRVGAAVSRRGSGKRQFDRVLVGIFVLGLSLFVADCRRPVAPPAAPPAVSPAVPAVQTGISQIDQSNMPPWEGGWSIIGRGSTVARFTQTFTPLTSTLASVEIDVMTGNRGRGGDRLTVKILDGTRVLATASRSIQEGYDGMLPFDFPSPGVRVTPGAPLHLLVEDTNKDVFGWRYGLNTYPGGVAYFNGTPWNDGAFDFRFRTYGF
jgi:hypothetical protein